MKNNFQSKSVPRGTRTIWRYLSALFLLFTFAIGNVWAADPTYEAPATKTYGDITFLDVAGTAKNATDVLGNDYLTYGAYYVAKTLAITSWFNSSDGSPASNLESTGYSITDAADYGFFAKSSTSSDINYGGTKCHSTRQRYFYVTGATSVAAIVRDGDTKGNKYAQISIQTVAEDGTLGTATVLGDYGSKTAGYLLDGGALDPNKYYKISFTSQTTTNCFMYQIRLGKASVPSCDATAPGNISKGALSAGILTLQVADDPKTGDEFYWQTSATGTTKNKTGENINFGKTYQVSAAGTYYIRSYNVAGDCWSDAKSFEVKAIDLVANYTVIYKDGTTELKSVNVAVGSAPAAYSPTKDCYTFAAWQKDAVDYDPANLASDAEANTTYTLTARWTPVYASGIYNFEGKSVTTSTTAASVVDGALYFSAVSATLDTGDPLYYGWKLKTLGATVKFLVQNNSAVKVTLKEKSPLNVTYTPLEGAETTEAAAKSATKTVNVKGGTIVTLTTTTDATTTLNKIEVLPLYTATRVDGKSDASGSDPNVLETTLPTPTAVSGWTFTGWVANQDVKDGDETKTAETILPAGTYTLLANTTFTAQWMEVTGTYDITYVSAHGTAPADDNAASVVLEELSAEGWAHKGWTADVDVTVDAVTVEAGTLIANGKTAILSSDVTFTAVWKEIFTVTFDAKGGSAVAPVDVEDGATLAAAPEDPTKDNYIFQGWSETDGGSVVADITAITISDDKTFYAIWALDVQVSEIVFSNSFKGWIHDGQVEVFYMAGESAPTIVSYDGKNLKAEGAVVISGDKVIATGTDDSEKEYDLTMTAVSPLTTIGAQTFDGTEGYVKTRHAWTSDRKWKMSKDAEDGRVARGETSMYIFLGAAESVTFDWGKQQKTNDVAVYVNGTFVKNIGKENNSAIPLTGGNNMVAFYSLQTSGDVWLNGLTTTPWVPVTAVTLKEGEAEISSKEIWASTSFTLTAEVTPDNASNKTITWTSSNDAVATVVNGVVNGVAASADPVTITASTVDGVTATCEVTVTAAPEPCETPVITAQPASQAYCAGSEPTLTVAANDPSDGGTLHYAWFKDDAAIGTDAATCVVDGAGTYKVVVTNHVDGKLDASTTSNEAVITLNVAAAITTQPTGKSDVVSGSEVTLSVVATNATGYQWYICDDAEKANASAISGAESADYVFNCSASAYYYCAVGNACGADVESNVVLVKLEPAGCNLIASIPDAEPYQYVQTGEWTLYGIDSNGKLATSNKFKNNAKDFDDNIVNAIEDQRVGMIFDKDIESLTIYATATSTGRTWKSDQAIRVTSDDITSGSPSYSNVTATRAVATMPANNKQYIFTADNMLIEAGKKVWLPFSGTVTIFKICYTAAPEKCEAPALPTLSSKELCAGDAFTSWDATSTVSDGGTLSYQWYNGDTDAALSGEDDAEFTPSADGNYYVIVTNKKAGYRDNTTKSATLSVEHFTGTAITEGLVDLRGAKDAEVTLTVTATGKNLHYAWKESATIDGTYTDVAGATDSKTLNVTVTEGMDKYYKVVVSSDCGSDLESVAHVTQFVPVSQQDVTASIVWDWSEAASVAQIKLTDTSTPKKNEGFVMANGAATIYNNANFESDKLYLEGEYIIRTEGGKLFQGQTIKFHTTVAGIVRVKFSHTGTNKPARELFVNGVGTGDSRTNTTAEWSRYVEVPAGDVSLTAFHVDPADGAGQQYIRVYEIEFLEKIDSRTEYAAGELGTACYEYDAVVIGATPYMVAGVNGNGYIVFDEITSGVIDAGKPYLFEADGGQIFFCKPIGVTAAPLANGEEITVKGMVGTFTGTTLTQGEDDICYFAGRHIWRVNDFSVDIDVDPHRCYVNYDVLKVEGPASAPAAGRRRVIMGVNGKDEAQGFENLESGDAPMKIMIDGTLYILRGEKVFDATGRLVK